MDYNLLNTSAAWAGVVLALASLAWNVYNTRQVNKKAGVNVELRPVLTDIPDKRGNFPAWWIINNSCFSVSIAEIGFSSVKRTLPFFKKRMGDTSIPVYFPILTDCPECLRSQQFQTVKLPLRLEAHESLTLAAPDLSAVEAAKRDNFHHIYVKTSNDHRVIADMGNLDIFH